MSVPFLSALEAPRLTTAQRDAIANPPTASIIYNTTDSRLEINTGTPGAPFWVPVGIGSAELIVEGEVPTSPFDGQRMIYMDSRTNPTYRWHMIYNAEKTGPNKWECIGGDPWVVSGLTGAPGSHGVWGKLVSVLNELVIYRSGQYKIEFGFADSSQFANNYFGFDTQYSQVSPGGAGLATGASYCSAGIPGSGDNSSVTVETVHVGGSAGMTVANLVPGWLSLYEMHGASSSGVAQAWMRVIPRAFA